MINNNREVVKTKGRYDWVYQDRKLKPQQQQKQIDIDKYHRSQKQNPCVIQKIIPWDRKITHDSKYRSIDKTHGHEVGAEEPSQNQEGIDQHVNTRDADYVIDVGSFFLNLIPSLVVGFDIDTCKREKNKAQNYQEK